MKRVNLILIFFAIGILSCNNNSKKDYQEHKQTEKTKEYGHNHANKHMHKNSVNDLIKNFESEDRSLTQKPYEVIALFGNLEGKKILDIGAGSGYFTFRLAEKGAHVIAGDVNDEFLEYIKSKMKENELFSKNIEIRKLPYESPSLAKEEVGHVIIVNTYHHIENRVDYFNQVKKGLTKDGMLMVVDFMKKKFKEKVKGPTYDMRISSSKVIEELKKAGFKRFETNNDLLPFQYILKAWKE
jgi:2-polyprenyl-3-methyl-5-hydroxy-6-metoxy-1,4-benzoquinol methylase